MARESVISQRIKFLIASFPANSKKKSESDPAGEKSSKLSMGRVWPAVVQDRKK